MDFDGVICNTQPEVSPDGARESMPFTRDLQNPKGKLGSTPLIFSL